MRALWFLIFLLSCSSETPKLHVFVWGEYLEPGLIKQFEQMYHCKVVINTFDSNESMLAKLQLGGGGYDVIFPSNYFVEILHLQGLLQPIDKTSLSNWSHVDPEVLAYLDQTTLSYSVPFTMGYGGIAYRDDRVEIVDKSWSVFDRQDLKGRMTLLNDTRETFGAALKFLGYSLNTTNPQEIQEAGDVLRRWKKNIAKFESEQYKNGIATAEYLVVHGYSGDTLQIHAEDPYVSFFLPKEGAALAIDMMVIPTSSKNSDLAKTFINFFLDPRVAAINTKYTKFLCTNRGAYPLLTQFFKENPVLFPSADKKKHFELIRYLGEKTTLYIKEWEKVKSSH